MKRYLTAVLAVAVLLGSAISSAYANAIDVKGDVSKGFLTINVDWTADTANFRGIPPSEIRKQIRNMMWDQVLPILVEKTKDYPLSYDDSQFVLEEENTRLLNMRPDGTKVYNTKLKIRFSCSKSPTAVPPITKEHMDDQFRYRFQVET